MTRFLVRRIALGVLVLWVISMLVFVMFFVAPQDVAHTIAGKNATPQTVAAVKRTLGLNLPIPTQYWHFLVRCLHGNLGQSYYTQVSVNSLIKSRLPATLSVMAGAAVIWMLLGVTNGVISAIRPRTVADRSLTAFSLFFYSLPTFVLGLAMLNVFFYQLHTHGLPNLPASGYVPLTQDPYQWFLHMILPWVTLALLLAATYTRLTRGSMLDVLGEDYIRTARAKGLSERRVVLRHGLRSALTPIVTQFGIDLGTLVGNLVVTETVFGISGIGKLSIDSITNGDLPVIIGVVLVASAAVVVMNIVVDIGYAVLDPRVRLN
ncbi:MAG TPA: ABC transporter permease [Mycobacteriales bacterium]|jgi:peptide/nickel transport system permease protein|nr:ABC transporter permease [Mycobacteriales bacterium]